MWPLWQFPVTIVTIYCDYCDNSDAPNVSYVCDAWVPSVTILCDNCDILVWHLWQFSVTIVTIRCDNFVWQLWHLGVTIVTISRDICDFSDVTNVTREPPFSKKGVYVTVVPPPHFYQFMAENARKALFLIHPSGGAPSIHQSFHSSVSNVHFAGV